ncbi:MAG: S9 family peptidase [Planctomycetaceae bacterium]|nr:S9 family peptidase [Planctomycetaceae bacterium]
MRKYYPTQLILSYVFFWIFAIDFAFAQTSNQAAPPDAALTVSRIYGGNEFNEASTSFIWDTEGAKFRVEKNGSYFLEDPITAERTLLIDAKWLAPTDAAAPLKPESLQFSKDRLKALIFTNTRRVWRHNTRGDYWALDLAQTDKNDGKKNGHSNNIGGKNPRLTKLGGDDAEEASLMFAKFSPDATQAAYVRGNNLYLENLTTRKITPLTTNGGDRYINGTFDWVYEEEFLLTDGFRWSPDGKKIAYWQLDTEEAPTFAMIDHLSEKYPVIRQFKYPRAGEKNAVARIGVVSVDTKDKNFGKTKWLQLPQRANDELLPGPPEEHYITDIRWVNHEDWPHYLIVQEMDRLQQHVMWKFVDTNQEGQQELYGIGPGHDPAWIDLPSLYWMKNDSASLHLGGVHWERLFYRADSNYRTIPLIKTIKDRNVVSFPITSDDMDVIDFVSFSYAEDKKTESGAYFYASPKNATQKYLYHASLTPHNDHDGVGSQRRITPEGQDGTHTYQISSDATLAIHEYSRFGEPPTVELVRLPSHEVVRTLTDNRGLKEKLRSLKLGKTELFQVTSPENVTMDGWAIYPPNYDSNSDEKHPVIVYVYGEPAGQTVLDQWGGNGYLWSQMLAQRGAVVMSFDNRGTPAPKGREWRKSVYRKLGLIGPKDQADAVREMLKKNPKLDANRVAIWGWSGGGTSTLHAMFQYPDVYQVGVAVAAVADERNYDTIYQERYMGNPATDAAEDYRLASPITYAQNLKGELLIIHGTTDDNCHYQTFEMLIDVLIKHGKQFRMASYPSRSHGIFEREGTTIHLRTLILDFFTEKLGLSR